MDPVRLIVAAASAYNIDGYFEPNDLNAYSINSITGERGADGLVTIQFGGCSQDTPNCLPVTAGWNYMVRLYRPRQEIVFLSRPPTSLGGRQS